MRAFCANAAVCAGSGLQRLSPACLLGHKRRLGQGARILGNTSGTLAGYLKFYMAVGQNQWYHFGVGAPPILAYFSGDWDVHWGHGHIFGPSPCKSRAYGWLALFEDTPLGVGLKRKRKATNLSPIPKKSQPPALRVTLPPINMEPDRCPLRSL